MPRLPASSWSNPARSLARMGTASCTLPLAVTVVAMFRAAARARRRPLSGMPARLATAAAGVLPVPDGGGAGGTVGAAVDPLPGEVDVLAGAAPPAVGARAAGGGAPAPLRGPDGPAGRRA